MNTLGIELPSTDRSCDTNGVGVSAETTVEGIHSLGENGFTSLEFFTDLIYPAHTHTYMYMHS